MSNTEIPQEVINQSWIYYWKYILLSILFPFLGIIGIIFGTATYNLSGLQAIIILITSFLLSAGVFLFIWINRASHKLYIYSKKLVYEMGFLNKTYKEIMKKDIRTIEVDQPFIDRILGIGSLKFATSGTEGYEIIFKGVKNPHKIKKDIEKSAEKIKKEEKLEKERIVRRKLKKTLRFTKNIKKKKTDDDKEKTQVKIYLKVYKTR